MLGIIIVNYKTVDETVDYITRELCKITLPHKIAVVDAACEDIEHAKRIADNCGGQLIEETTQPPDPDVRVYVLPHTENPGYARGNNYGASFLRNHFRPDYYLFSNNDVSLPDRDVVETLIETAKRYDDAAAVGPRIMDTNGEDQSPKKEISIWKKYIWPQLLLPFTYLLCKKRCFSDLGPCETGYCYWVNGSFFLVKADAFWRAEGFDPGTFLYAEEAILAERFKRLGYREYFVHTVRVIHRRGGTTQNHHLWKQGMKLSFESNLFYYRHYKNVSRPALLLAKAVNFYYLNICLECGKRVKKRLSKC